MCLRAMLSFHDGKYTGLLVAIRPHAAHAVSRCKWIFHFKISLNRRENCISPITCPKVSRRNIFVFLYIFLPCRHALEFSLDFYNSILNSLSLFTTQTTVLIADNKLIFAQISNETLQGCGETNIPAAAPPVFTHFHG